MRNDNLPPELTGADDEPSTPSRMNKRQRTLKVVGIVALASLVLPGILVTWSTSQRTAQAACFMAVDYYAPTATGFEADFQIFPLRTFGWVCHASMADGTTLPVAALGVLPGSPRLTPLTGT
jgi:hypothetical protein